MTFDLFWSVAHRATRLAPVAWLVPTVVSVVDLVNQPMSVEPTRCMYVSNKICCCCSTKSQVERLWFGGSPSAVEEDPSSGLSLSLSVVGGVLFSRSPVRHLTHMCVCVRGDKWDSRRPLTRRWYLFHAQSSLSVSVPLPLCSSFSTFNF